MQSALAKALGKVADEHREPLGDAAGPVLRELVVSGGSPHPEVRLTALVQLARCAPESLPGDTVGIALDVMRHAYEQKAAVARAAAPEPERARTDTMVSYLRQLEATHYANAGTDAPPGLLRDLHGALGDRTELRFPLFLGQLHSPEWGQRMAAIRMCGEVLRGWRPLDDAPVTALARQLREPELRFNKAALEELRDLAPISRGVSEDVVAYPEAWSAGDRGHETGLRWADTAVGKAFDVLALQGDERVVNALTSVVGRLDTPPQHLERWLRALGREAAAELGPVLHDRLAALGPDDRSTAGDRLVGGLGIVAHTESLPLLASLGPAAAPLAESVREADGGARAAVTLWKISANADEALPPLLHHWTAAARSRPAIAACLADMGAQAAPALPLIRAELASPRRHHNDGSAPNLRHDITADEELLRDCRRTVAALETGAP